MPNRIIKESICTSPSIDCLTAVEETMFYRLIVNCDDYGRFDGRLPILKARLFPLKSKIKEDTLVSSLSALISAGLVTMYEVDHRPILQLTGWGKHQTIRTLKSKYPNRFGVFGPDDEGKEGSENICTQLHTIECKCVANPIQSESESKSDPDILGTDGAQTEAARNKNKRFIPPAVQEVEAYCKERGNAVDAAKWHDYYSAKGWMIGKSPMRDWRAAVRTWERNAQGTGKAPPDITAPYEDFKGW